MENSSAKVTHHMDHLLLAKAICSEPHQEIKECPISAEFTDDADLGTSGTSLFDLRLVHYHDVIVPAKLALKTNESVSHSVVESQKSSLGGFMLFWKMVYLPRLASRL